MRTSIFLFIFIFSTLYLVGQSGLEIHYAPIKRTQIGGPQTVILPNHFQYLRLFKKDQRFAPDEPSSFSSIEYFFKGKMHSEQFTFQWSIGLFRNHIKGDIFLNQNAIHFGRGNSHFGVSSSQVIKGSLFKSSFIGAFNTQIGIGPLVTQFRNDDLIITPSEWGINGYGALFNFGCKLYSPKIYNRISFFVGTLFNFSLVKFRSINTRSAQGEEMKFSNLHFTSMNKVPAINFGLTYSFLKQKEEK